MLDPHDTILQQANELAAKDAEIARLRGPLLARHQPCGCQVCTCASDERCSGCGAHMCNGSECVFKEDGLSPLYVESDIQKIERRAKIEVLEEVREDIAEQSGCEYTAGIDEAVGRIDDKLQQLKNNRAEKARKEDKEYASTSSI